MSPAIKLRHKARNLLHSVLLIGGMAGIVALCAWTIWGGAGLVWAFAAVALGLALTPSIPSSMILSLYRAVPLPREAAPELHAVVDELAARAALEERPKLYYLPSRTLNAFTVGRRRDAAITVSDGLVRRLSLREIAAVLAHELSHVRNNDLWLMALADSMSRFTSLVSYFGLLLVLINLPLALIGEAGISWLLVALLVFAPTIMSLFQLALSRAREYEADLDAAALTGDPQGLAAALEKLERYQGRLWEEILLPGRRIPEPSLLRTHPPTAERIRRLKDLAPPRPPRPAPAQQFSLPGTFHAIDTPARFRWPGLWY
jgi:heat shock protein HtpX